MKGEVTTSVHYSVYVTVVLTDDGRNM